MPRPRQLQFPLDDALLDAFASSALVTVSRSRWDAYANRFPALRRGRRIVQVNTEGKGVYRWLKSAVIEHMHTELARERPPAQRTQKQPATTTTEAEGAA